MMTLFSTPKTRTQSLTRDLFFSLLGIKLSERCSLNAKILAFLGHWWYMETREKTAEIKTALENSRDKCFPRKMCINDQTLRSMEVKNRDWWVSWFLSSKSGPVEPDRHQEQKERPKMHSVIWLTVLALFHLSFWECCVLHNESSNILY